MFNTSVLRTVLILLSASGIIFSIPVPFSAGSLFILPSVELEDYLEELLSGITHTSPVPDGLTTTYISFHTSPVPEDFTTELQNVPLCETAEQRTECEAILEAHFNHDSEEYRQLQKLKDSHKRLQSFTLSLPEEASIWGYTELLQVLLRIGVPVNKKYLFEETLLHSAVRRGHDDMVTFLLSQGADIHAKDCFGSTPLHRAVSLFKSKTAKLLLNAGANANVANTFNETPLFLIVKHLTPSEILFQLYNKEHMAEYKNRRYVIGTDIIEMLLEHGADTNIANNQRMTALHVAAKNSNLTIVQLLINGGANINATDDNNQTPLHKATESNNLSVVEYLIEIGCDKKITDSNKKTALDIAEEKNLTEIVHLLCKES